MSFLYFIFILIKIIYENLVTICFNKSSKSRYFLQEYLTATHSNRIKLEEKQAGAPRRGRRFTETGYMEVVQTDMCPADGAMAVASLFGTRIIFFERNATRGSVWRHSSMAVEPQAKPHDRYSQLNPHARERVRAKAPWRLYSAS